ncbi:hypothetical protein DEO72_LG10g3938 [Vigna unguiculata]|uniref:Uncharacterized protein n=1 Tax=Vigna unguiculata TaxID=3917 RepID=A0A4D6NG06_VIGUN|nr:hypothetical protein DEO72_LG10g3938 [Vigna unguiculata]
MNLCEIKYYTQADVEPIGRTPVVEDNLVDDVLEACFVLSVNLLIGNAQLGFILFSLLPPVLNRSNGSQMLQGQIVKTALELAQFVGRLLGLLLLLFRPIVRCLQQTRALGVLRLHDIQPVEFEL